jgi:hypothetical protein
MLVAAAAGLRAEPQGPVALELAVMDLMLLMAHLAPQIQAAAAAAAGARRLLAETADLAL